MIEEKEVRRRCGKGIVGEGGGIMKVVMRNGDFCSEGWCWRVGRVPEFGGFASGGRLGWGVVLHWGWSFAIGRGVPRMTAGKLSLRQRPS